MKINMDRIKPARSTSRRIRNKTRKTNPVKNRIKVRGLIACIGSRMPSDPAITASVG
jgi:hypothetical protein